MGSFYCFCFLLLGGNQTFHSPLTISTNVDKRKEPGGISFWLFTL